MSTGLVNQQTVVELIEEDVQLHEIIANRRSPKGFVEKAVEPGMLRSLLEAARWSPSSRNEQPWRFIVASKAHQQAEYDKLFSTLNDSNRVWAHQASALIAVAAKLTSSRDGKPNRLAQYDTGGAVANLTAQAVSLGLQVHQMGGFNSQMLRQLYNVPDDFELMAVLAIGYSDDGLLGQRQRVRKELGQFVFQGEWEKSSNMIGAYDASIYG